MVTIEDVTNAVQKFVEHKVKEGYYVDIEGFDYVQLTNKVNEEYAAGQAGSLYGIIVDIDNNMGLEQFGLYVD